MSAADGRVLVDGTRADAVSVFDRGLAYGDGLFETIRLVDGHAPLWTRHMQRLQEGCQRLRLAMPDPALLLREVAVVADDLAQAVVRITLTRGTGPRGYAPPPTPRPTRIVAAFEAPGMRGDAYVQGIRVRWCDTRLARQPLLAGIKHLNRLEQVLARAEWNDPAVVEGLLCDTAGQVISATMANVFAVIDGELVTPAVDECGVAGVGRAEVLASWPGAKVLPLSRETMAGAAEIFLSSSVRGILPVQAVDHTVYVPGPVTRALQQHWRGLGFPMEQA
ncbi:aminodeoxychorismate lyase [Dyella soli]|uniref:Aminodeoxychorismate lyase n=1 Tax=Dyella soli TaxID=522319 RepID=A0A4V2NLN8_9GAMM|nr:aminodeoxychorismate lyase [Dyella soli]TCI09871.1 aminodeoxychorismate lyase [Dyella soli]